MYTHYVFLHIYMRTRVYIRNTPSQPADGEIQEI